MAGLSGDEYAQLRHRVSELVETIEDKRRSATAASETYPMRKQWLLGEADAYEDAADELRDLLKEMPK